MVVFHSPVQRQRRMPFSASPAPPGPLDEDPDNIFNATPGPARARSVLEGTSASKGRGDSSSHVKQSSQNTNNIGMPGSARLQQRLQQSLMMVADSPSSKLNAPDPFRPRKQLRRSPPAAMGVLDHRHVDANKQSDTGTRTPEQHAVLLMDEPVPHLSIRDLSVPPPLEKETQKSYEVAAKALFDDRKSNKDLSHSRGGASLPALAQSIIFLTPQASTSSHRRKPSLQDDPIQRSAPMRQSKSNTSTASAPAGARPAASPGTPGNNATPVRALAKIGRLTARNADLEAKLMSSTSELESILQTHEALQEEYEFIMREKEAAMKRVQEYEEIAVQCEELIESHERLQSTNVELEQQRQADIVEVETLKEAMGKLKWKERKLRHELHIRREEGICREYELQNEHLNPALRELRIENCNLKVSVADIREKSSIAEYEKKAQARSLQAAQKELIWYEEVTKTHQDDLSTLQKRVDKRTRIVAELEEEQRQLSQRLTEEVEENDQLKLRLDDAQQRISDLEKQSQQGREAQNGYIGSQTAVRRLEKEVKALEAQLADRNLKLEKKIQNLQKAVDDKETKLDQATVLHQNLFKKSEEQLKQSQQDLKAAELKLRLVEKERDQLKNSWDMHRRASRVFGDGPSQTEAEAGIGSALPPLTEHENHVNDSKLAASPLGKRKRDRREEIRQEPESDEEDAQENGHAALSDSPPPRARAIKPEKKDSTKISKNMKETKKKIKKPILESDSEDDSARARPAKRTKQAKRKEMTPSDDEADSASDGDQSQKQSKRKRRRTAIKSGVPEQFRKKLKEEADHRGRKKQKQKERLYSESDSESSESTSEESDSVKVASSPRNSSGNMKSGTSNSDKGTKKSAPASHLSKSSKVAAQEKAKPTVKTEKLADTSSKSATSGTTSSLGTKKKIALHKSASSNFIWGSGSAGTSQSAIPKGLFGLPDVLSPVVKR